MRITDSQLFFLRVLAGALVMAGISASLFAELIFGGDGGARLSGAGVRLILIIAPLAALVEHEIDRRRKAGRWRADR